jgi:hypothetical protein
MDGSNGYQRSCELKSYVSIMLLTYYLKWTLYTSAFSASCCPHHSTFFRKTPLLLGLEMLSPLTYLLYLKNLVDLFRARIVSQLYSYGYKNLSSPGSSGSCL